MLFFSITLLVFLGRINSSIFGYELLNTDEFVIGAKANRLLSEYKFYEFDGDTSGILNALFLLWPGIFDLEISYLSIRISSVIIVGLILFFTCKIIYLFSDKKESLLLSIPLILFFSFTKDPDFLHFTNEMVSTLLIISSLYIYLKNYNQLSFQQLFSISFLSGSVLFAKMQFFPVACILVFVINIRVLFKDKSIKNFLVSSIGFILPAGMISIYYLANDELKDLFYNVIYFPLSDFFARNEVTQKELIIGSNNLQTIMTSGKKKILFNHLILNSLFHLLYMYFIYFLFLSINIKFKNFKDYIKEIFDFKLLILSLTIISTLFIIFITGSVHRHYFVNLLPLIPIFLAIFTNLNKKAQRIKNISNHYILLILIFIFTVSLVFENKKFYSKNFVQRNFFDNEISLKSPEIYQYLNLDKKKDKAIVWGWKPEIYLLSGLKPSNRETTNLKQIDFRPGREYFKERFILEFSKKNPEILIDYAKENSLFYSDEKYGVKSFTKLEKILSKDYIKIFSSDKKCPDFYLLKDKYLDLEKKIVNYSFSEKNTSLLKNINDFQIDEDLCQTSVNLSIIKSNFIELNVEKNKKIKEIKILSSKNNLKSELIEFEFINENKTMIKKKVVLRKYPFWTTIIIKNPMMIDKVLINIKDLKNKNFGINEIKLYSK